MLDLQIDLHRNKRQVAQEGARNRRLLWLAGGVFLLGIGIAVAFFLLSSMAHDLPRQRENSESALIDQ